MHAIAAAVHASTPDHAQLAGCSKLAQLLPVLLLDVVRPARYAVRFWRHRCRQTQGLLSPAQAGSACEPDAVTNMLGGAEFTQSGNVELVLLQENFGMNGGSFDAAMMEEAIY